MDLTILKSQDQPGAKQAWNIKKEEWKKRAVSAKAVVNTFKEKHKVGKILQQFLNH